MLPSPGSKSLYPQHILEAAAQLSILLCVVRMGPPHSPSSGKFPAMDGVARVFWGTSLLLNAFHSLCAPNCSALNPAVPFLLLRRVSHTAQYVACTDIQDYPLRISQSFQLLSAINTTLDYKK